MSWLGRLEDGLNALDRAAGGGAAGDAGVMGRGAAGDAAPPEVGAGAGGVALGRHEGTGRSPRGGLRGVRGGSPRGGGAGGGHGGAASRQREAAPKPTAARGPSGARRGLGAQLGAGARAEGPREEGSQSWGGSDQEGAGAVDPAAQGAAAAAAVRSAISDAAKAAAGLAAATPVSPRVQASPLKQKAARASQGSPGEMQSSQADNAPAGVAPERGPSPPLMAEGGKVQGGAGREERLAKAVEKLQSRVKQLKAENEQLEELVQAAERRAGDAAVQDLEQRVKKLQRAQERDTEAARAVIDKKDAEIIGLRAQLGAAQSSAAAADERAQSLEEGSAQALQARAESEAKVMAELRGELAASEQALEAERGAHRATLQKAGERETELESNLDENSAALAAMQGRWDAQERRVSELEAEVQRLEAEGAAQEVALASAEAAGRSHSGSGAEPAMEKALAEALSERDRLAEELAVASASGQELEAAAEKHRVRVQELTRNLEEQREKANIAAAEDGKAQELAELLYEKQRQLEDLAANRNAKQMALERQLAEARSEVEQSRSRRRVQSGGDIEDVVPIDSMGPVYNRLANDRRVGRYISRGARMVDASASTVSVLLLRHPLFRLAVFCYLVSIHGFVYLLLSRIQKHAIAAAGVNAGP